MGLGWVTLTGSDHESVAYANRLTDCEAPVRLSTVPGTYHDVPMGWPGASWQ